MALRRAVGEITWSGPGGQLVRDVQRCVHCGAGWVIDERGPERGFCRRCYGPTCDRGGCLSQCLHWEEELELVEKRPGSVQRCAHCHISWRPTPGSGRLRGWCLVCNGALCGARSCATHPDRSGLYRSLLEDLELIGRA